MEPARHRLSRGPISLRGSWREIPAVKFPPIQYHQNFPAGIQFQFEQWWRGNRGELAAEEPHGWREGGGKDSANQVIVIVETEKLEGELAWLERVSNSRRLVVIPVTTPKMGNSRENETFDLFVFLQLCSSLSIQPAIFQSPRFFPVTTDWRELQRAGKKGGNDV